MKTRWFAGVALLLLVPFMHVSCMEEEPVILSPVNIPCEENCDCYTGDMYLLGTLCYDGICRCPVEFDWMYAFPCCEKGRPIDDCRRQCRAIEECAPDEIDVHFLPPGYVWPPKEDGAGGAGGSGSASSSSSGSTSSSSSSGDVVKPECVDAAECAIQPDSRCGKVECVNGKCEVTIAIGAIQAQVRGDCHRLDCDVKGQVVDVDDPSDVYNDGKQCSFDICEQGKVVNKAFPDGFTCPETGSGVCFAGECVDCVNGVTSCGNGQVCDYTTCVPMHCQDFVFQPALGETDLDCGGPCRPCPALGGCGVDADCADGVCMNGSCKPPSCTDGVKNDGETGIDCGGPPSCPRCAVGAGCAVGGDCESGVCWAGVCEGL